jgi:hypothetical protein
MKAGAPTVALVFLLAWLGPSPCPAAGGESSPGAGESAEWTVGDLTLRLSDGRPFQGDPVLAEVSSAVPFDNVFLAWKGAEFPMRPAGPGAHHGLFGVDLLDPPGRAVLTVLASRGGRVARAEVDLEVRERSFPVQRLTLPERMTRFDAATLERIQREAAALADRFSRAPSPAMWTLPFHPPVEGFRPVGFGSRRIINGEPRSPHAGADAALPAGTPVAAIADGIVAFVGEQFFAGKSVVLDHGAGLFSVYYHLEAYTVAEGQRVARGERIGAVGATGRATAPHLHFGVRAAGGRVDPSRLLALPPR